MSARGGHSDISGHSAVTAHSAICRYSAIYGHSGVETHPGIFGNALPLLCEPMGRAEGGVSVLRECRKILCVALTIVWSMSIMLVSIDQPKANCIYGAKVMTLISPLDWELSPEGVFCAEVVKPEGAIMADESLCLRIVKLSGGRYCLSLLDDDGCERTADAICDSLDAAMALADRMVPAIHAGTYDVMCCMHCGTDVYQWEVVCCSCNRRYHRR